jgi:non-canonical (house-cleaning) NTP pyrophosphatase
MERALASLRMDRDADPAIGLEGGVVRDDAGGAVGVLTSGLILLLRVCEMLTTHALSRWFAHGLWERLPDSR